MNLGLGGADVPRPQRLQLLLGGAQHRADALDHAVARQATRACQRPGPHAGGARALSQPMARGWHCAGPQEAAMEGGGRRRGGGGGVSYAPGVPGARARARCWGFTQCCYHRRCR